MGAVPVRIGVALVLSAFAILAWLPPAAPRPEGALVAATAGCGGCHTLPHGTERGIGPDLTELAEVAPRRVEGLSAEQYVRQSIRRPSAFVVAGYPQIMPALDLTEEQIEAVVRFLLEEPDRIR